MANSIDTNTAETFRIGIWYRSDDSSLALRIVPIILADFTDIFEALFKSGKFSEGPSYLRNLLVHLLQFSNEPPLSWKNIMRIEIQRNISKLIS
ncbi:AlwI family type II restriction endonuclease [Fictibacillus enclensis]|uniref:AlwI family type II restriction endonuclease n=1 Tax=Fictibacillus enclensis TaxID=1017270 RepID=UPI003334AA6A